MRYAILLAGALLACELLSGGCKHDDEIVVPRLEPAPAPRPAQPPAARAEITLTPLRTPGAERDVHLSESTHTLNGTNLRVADLISLAWRTPPHPRSTLPLLSALRVVSDPPLARTRYDVQVYQPGASAVQLRSALRQQVTETFGVTVRRELRAADAYVLTAPLGRLQAPAAGRGTPRGAGGSAAEGVDAATPLAGGQTTLTGSDLDLLAEQLEEYLRRPVLNETGLQTAEYRVEIPQRPNASRTPAGDSAAVRTALRAQLGLELQPARRDVEYLFVVPADLSAPARPASGR